MSTGNDPLMFMAASNEETRINFWNHHSVNYLESMIQRAQAEAAPNLSPEATIANVIGNTEDAERNDVVTPSKFDDCIAEEVILDDSEANADFSLVVSSRVETL